MTGRLRLVLGDQLTRDLSALADLDKAQDVVLMVEVAEETGYVRHHKKKIVLLLSAMRASGMRWSPRAIRMAIEASALPTPNATGASIERWALGRGLLQAKSMQVEGILCT